MKTPFHKAIEEIQDIKMTTHEKELMMKHIMNVPVSAGIKSGAVKSPWTIYSFSTWIQTHRVVTAFAALLIVILSGNSVVLASQNTVPGDTLYPIKTAIVEPVRLALAPTTAARAEVRAEIVQNRLQEVEILTARDTLDEEKETKIRERIDTQVAILNKDLEKVRENDDDKATEINTTLEASLNAHERIVATIARSRGRGKVTVPSAAVVAKQPEAAVMMMSVAADPTEAGTVATEPVVAARAMKVSISADNANPRKFDGSDDSDKENVGGKVESKELKSDARNNKDLYQKKKASVESLIDTASQDVSSTSSKKSSVQETIANDARETIDRARQKLVEADERDESGDDDGAYSALVDSERSAKEARILIKAQERLEKEVKQNKPAAVKALEGKEELRKVDQEKKGDGRGNSKER